MLTHFDTWLFPAIFIIIDPLGEANDNLTAPIKSQWVFIIMIKPRVKTCVDAHTYTPRAEICRAQLQIDGHVQMHADFHTVFRFLTNVSPRELTLAASLLSSY